LAVVIFCYVVAAVCLVGGLQERKDMMRCAGFLLFGLLAALVGTATQFMPDDKPPVGPATPVADRKIVPPVADAVPPADAPPVEAAAKPPAKAAPAGKWLDANRGDLYRSPPITVEVTGYGVGHVSVDWLGQDVRSDDEFLKIRVEVRNINPTRKIDFEGWSHAILNAPRLTDDLGNRYEPARFKTGATIPGQVSSATLYTGKEVTDLLVFQRPVPAATRLYLELPPDNVGTTEPIRFTFIAKLPPDPPRAPTPKGSGKGVAKTAPAESPKAEPPDPEKIAAAKLELIRRLVRDGNTGRARDRLQQLIADYPGTKAADDAKKLLAGLP
jgi:hypothetical protein